MLAKELKVKTSIERGGFGEFTVLVGDKIVMKRTTVMLPSDELVLETVCSQLNSEG